MDFKYKYLLSVIISLAIGLFLVHFLVKNAKREGKTIKYIPLKAILFTVFPTVIFFIFLSEMPLIAKTGGIFVVLIGGIAQFYNLITQRKNFRKIFGLPPEDEDTGEVIKKDK